MTADTPQDAWTALGWSPRDMETLRAHATAMGIQVPIPAAPPGRRLPAPPPMKEKPPVKAADKQHQNRITHVGFVLDASGSMEHLRHQVVKVADAQIAHLAKQSKELDQETRVTVYSFDDTAKCLIYDKDVLRLPSLANLYQIGGRTALVDATILAMDDLAMTPEKYGDHAFLMFVITDGEENASTGTRNSWNTGWNAPPMGPLPAERLRKRMAQLPAHWTMAALVPNMSGKHTAQQFGFPPGNIAVWDATSERGMEEAMARVSTATDTYMTARSVSGIRSTTSLFDISAAVVNADAILAAGLTRVDYDEYELIPIPGLPPKISDEDWALAHPGKKRKKPLPWGGEIGDFVRKVNGGRYEIGKAFYQLTENRAVNVQPNKTIMILDTKDSRVYRGSPAAVRKLLNLPEDVTVRIKPTASDRFRVYVKSTSDNRHLYPGAPLLLFK